jgi:hypothetical protein
MGFDSSNQDGMAVQGLEGLPDFLILVTAEAVFRYRLQVRQQLGNFLDGWSQAFRILFLTSFFRFLKRLSLAYIECANLP